MNIVLCDHQFSVVITRSLAAYQVEWRVLAIDGVTKTMSGFFTYLQRETKREKTLASNGMGEPFFYNSVQIEL